MALELKWPVKLIRQEGKMGLDHGFYYSQSMSRVTSISKNGMNIGIPLRNVRHLNGVLNISVEIVPKKMH